MNSGNEIDDRNHRDGCQRRGNMKIAVVGATGATGLRVVKHALVQGHFVTAVARRPERLSSADRLSFVRGVVPSPGGLTGALDGVDAVISCIGRGKNLSPGTLMSVGVASPQGPAIRSDRLSASRLLGAAPRCASGSPIT